MRGRRSWHGLLGGLFSGFPAPLWGGDSDNLLDRQLNVALAFDQRAQLIAATALDLGEHQTPGFACKPRHPRIGPQDSDDALNDGGDRGVGVRLVKGREPGHGVLGNIRNGVGHDALLFGADELARLAGIVCGELLPLNDVEVVQSMPAIARLR
jgi:hypothetical protein